MTKITDIMSMDALEASVRNKHVTKRRHPLNPSLVVLNYTDIVAYQGLWDEVTLNSRGLIYDEATYDVVARAFKKFFNYGQAGAPEVDLDAPIYHVADKLDGSLGIVFLNPYTDELEIATRGSFESEQANRATWMLDGMLGRQENYRYDIEQGFTPLVEIIYPENRIVVDYGTAEALIDLGIVENATGDYTAPLGWRVKTTLRGVLDRPNRPNAEGWVVWLDAQTAVKIKQQDYIELHRIVTGLNRKSVWRALSEGHDKYLALLAQLPDELYAWAEGVGNELNRAYAMEMREIDGCYVSVVEQYEDAGGEFEEMDRGLFARLVKQHVAPNYQGFMFSLLDGRDIQAKIWKSVEPAGGER